ncbi:hypothetical protein B0H11DRAFT_2193462 [Mycena galericulata]|nr:hypothetical protein B0H11DRAFT_2193462 [Mycena galericulata]
MVSSMVSLLLPSLFLLVQGATSLPKNYTTISRDVVVIGGGASGTYAAVKLLESSHSVAVLEREGRLGGQIYTYRDPATNAPFNLGTAVYYNNTINNAFFSLLGVATGPYVAPAGGNAYLDFATGKPVPGFDPDTQFTAWLPALLAYNSYISETYPYLTLSYENLTYPVPDELLEPFTVFAERHNFTAMLQFYDQNIQNIGNLWQLPTYHGIHAFDSKLVEFILQGYLQAASGDNQDIYTAAAAYLGSENVFLNSTILGVDRSGACFGEKAAAAVCVLSTAPASSGKGKTTTLTKARKLLVAIPPSLSSLASAKLDLDAQERSLFGRLSGFTYGLSVFSAPGLNNSEIYNNIGTHTPDNLLSLPGSFDFVPLPEGRFAATFGPPNDATWTPAYAQSLVSGEVARMNGGDIEFDDFTVIVTDFRLSAAPSDVASGFYKELYALEGTKNTFWTGGAWTEADSSQIWWWSDVSLLPKMEAALA